MTYYLHGLTVKNKAIPSETAKSYRENYWDHEVQVLLNSGDYVVFEFGLSLVMRANGDA